MARNYSLVALLDVLAYREHLRADRASGEEAFKAKLESALSVLSSINETDLAYQAISDTIIISANPSTPLGEFLTAIAKVQKAFLQSGLLIRGGIAFEQHFKSGHLTYSHALAVAHELEQKQAIYPRVVVDKSVIDMLSGTRFVPEDVRRVHDERLICVQDGVFFVNFIVGDVETCYDFAKRIFESEGGALHGREPELAKHRWLQDYIVSFSNGQCEAYMGGIACLSIQASSGSSSGTAVVLGHAATIDQSSKGDSADVGAVGPDSSSSSGVEAPPAPPPPTA